MFFEKLIGIGACAPNGAIGKKGMLPWNCPEDLKYFSDTVSGSPLIMGYRTFLTLPASYYKKQIAIVFSYRKSLPCIHPNVQFVSSLEKCFALKGTCKNLYVIGGAQIYRLFLEANLIQEFLLTRLKAFYQGDTFFPFSFLEKWERFTIQDTPLFTIRRYVYTQHNQKLGHYGNQNL